MKHGKKPTLLQKKRVASYDLEPKDWLIVKDCRDVFLIKHRKTGKIICFDNLEAM